MKLPLTAENREKMIPRQKYHVESPWTSKIFMNRLFLYNWQTRKLGQKTIIIFRWEFWKLQTLA